MAVFERCVVLAADDEPTILRLVSHALRRHGYTVIEAPDGPTALRKCQEDGSPIHLALLDVMMPGMTGPELFRRLRDLHPDIAVLFMSGYKPEQIAHLTPGINHAQFIAKPFLPRDLVMRVNAVLGNSEVCVPLDDEAEATRV